MKFGINSPKKIPSLITQSSNGLSKSNGSNVWLWIFAVLVIIIIVSIGCWSTTDSFVNFKSKFMKTENLKDIDVIMFMNPKCQYCQKMMAVLDSEGKKNDLKIVDITTDSGKKIAKEFGSDNQPVPSFISLKYKTGWVGSLPSTAELVKKLSSNKSQVVNETKPDLQPGDNVKDMEILMFSREGCPHCVNAKTKLEEVGLLAIITSFDVTTEEGQQKIQELGLEIKGVPSFYCIKTGKMTSGFKSVDEVLAELK